MLSSFQILMREFFQKNFAERIAIVLNWPMGC